MLLIPVLLAVLQEDHEVWRLTMIMIHVEKYLRLKDRRRFASAMVV